MGKDIIDAVHADHQRKAEQWAALLTRYQGASLLPGISRDQFEAALRVGFDTAWAEQFQHYAGIPLANIQSTHNK